MTDPSLALGFLVIATFFATAVQTLAGFAFALIMMPIVTLILGVHTAAPLVALTALTLYGVNIFRHHESLNFQELWRLGAAATAGVPVGIWMVANANDAFVKVLLGLILIGYGLYGLTRPSPQRPCSPRWAYLAGFVSGSLGGAYNTSGPPLAIYGALRQWPKDEFRVGLQSLFFVSGALTVLSHAFANHLTPTVFRLFAWTPPALLLGILAGAWVDRFVDKERFRVLVLAMILVLGISLALNLGRR
jgi:uncharacterized membrane protein YfcA